MIRKPILPVDAILPEAFTILQHTTNLVIEAPPGAGKTTRVPPAVLGLVSGEVIVLEPRRIAARLAARTLAHPSQEGESADRVPASRAIAHRCPAHGRFLTDGQFVSEPLMCGSQESIGYNGSDVQVDLLPLPRSSKEDVDRYFFWF